MRRTITLTLAIIVGLVTLAYGFAVTQVNLQELGSATRQQSLTRILRALARPDFISFAQEEFVVETPISIPCPVSPQPTADPDASQPYLIVTPPCAEPQSEVVISGFNFAPNTTGPLNFIPPSGVSLQLGTIQTDANGAFELTVRLRDRVSEEPQLLRAVTRQNVGAPQLSQNGRDTLYKIIETVFMALLATLLGTILAVPISFFAAQNLMRMVRSPLLSMALSMLAIPLGVWLGLWLARWVGSASEVITTSVVANLGGVIAAPVLLWGMVRISGAQLTEQNARPPWLRWLLIGLGLLVAVLALFLLAELAELAGRWLARVFNQAAFFGNFVTNVGEILRLLLPLFCALIGAGLLSGLAGGLGQRWIEQGSAATTYWLHLIAATAAGALLAALIGAGIGWLYELRNLNTTLWWPALIGGVGGLLLALRTPHTATLPVGLAIYNVTRTILNALRSVEALIMVIVFAVWVGIGPFAGVLALGLHTIASLAKLYSEQVEEISAGPLEALQATGANRLQMIVYAVLPQIVPPYISFTMYRWDINVRMSTIIGFAGGGGIGFLLQQNINLLNYRAASAQILAIAIVVSLMDYLSSALRQRAI